MVFINIYIGINTFIENENGDLIPENYDYWLPLLSAFLKDSDSIEIHCWNLEKDAIKELTPLLHPNITGDPVVFKGNITDPIRSLLINNFLEEHGRLKWFSLFLKKGKEPHFHAEHWGTEFYIPNVKKEIIPFVKSVMSRIDVTMHFY